MIGALRCSHAVKLLRLIAEIARGALILRWQFPTLPANDRLRQIQTWSRRMLMILNLEIEPDGLARVDGPALIVANHLSWLDILVIQSLMPAVFVAKEEVRHWPLIGSMAKTCGAIFVKRTSPQSVRAMVDSTVAIYQQGRSVVGFPEGTSTDGSDLGTFHANIFEGAVQCAALVHPVTLRYVHTQTGQPADAALFIGDMSLWKSLRRVMATPSITALAHIGADLSSQGHTRKSLAKQAHRSIRDQLMRRTENMVKRSETISSVA